MITRNERRDRAAAAMAVRELVRRIARAFAPAGIPVLPLKGALLQQTAYDDPADRLVNDLDLLVGADLERAEGLLLAAGYTRLYAEPGDRQRVLTVPGGGFHVDLHRELFFPGQFCLSAESVLGRARVDETLFGARVLLADPYDTWTHLVGHLALTFLVTHARHHPDDLARLAERAALDAAGCARRLVDARMARAARYALPMAGDRFSLEVLARLPPDPLAAPLARLVTAVVPRLPVNRGLGLVPAKVLHRSLPSAARALVEGAARRIARRIG